MCACFSGFGTCLEVFNLEEWMCVRSVMLPATLKKVLAELILRNEDDRELKVHEVDNYMGVYWGKPEWKHIDVNFFPGDGRDPKTHFAMITAKVHDCEKNALVKSLFTLTSRSKYFKFITSDDRQESYPVVSVEYNYAKNFTLVKFQVHDTREMAVELLDVLGEIVEDSRK